MSIEKNKNGYLITKIVNNQLIKLQYSFYTKKDAIHAFKQYLKEITTTQN
jgi:hypothetical protein